MSSEEHNKQSQQMPSSFSSPDIDTSLSQQASTSSSSQMVTSTATTIGAGSTTLTTSMVKSSTTNGIKFNTTRDSGFSDSIVEDNSSSSLSTLANKQATSRTEHALNVTESNDINLVTKCFVDKGKLKSVEEDIHITPATVETTTVTSQGADDANKEFITIVKTTKVTTKVKHVNGKSNKKNKNKNKRRKSFEKSEEDDETNVNEVEQQSQSNENRTITTTTTTTIESASTLVTTHDDNDDESLQININKIGEELIYDNSNQMNVAVPKLDITLLSSSTTETSHLNNQVDLNSTVLDCEEILSNYSTTNIGSPRIGEISMTPARPVNEVANVVDVLSDVTMSLINKPDEKNVTSSTTEPSKETKKKSKAAKVEKKATTPKKEKKRQKFPSCFKTIKDEENDETGFRTSQKRKNDKSVPVQESPSKQLKSESGISSKTPIIFNKYTLLDEPQKERIIYLKPQCVDLLVNRLEQIESTGLDNKNNTQLSYLNENNYSLRIILSKMLNRSLDLLRHDRIESFDALANQLKTEYKLADDLVDTEKDTIQKLSDSFFTHINLSTHDLVFRLLLRQILIDDKVLLSLDLDKTKMKPYEEVIEFLSEEKAATAWVKKFDKQKRDEEEEKQQNGAKDSISKKNANLISEQIELNKPVKNIQEESADSSKKMITKTSGETQRVKNPDEKTAESLNAKNEIEAKLLDTLNDEKNLTEKLNQQNSTSSCGTTPPPTPQNELNQSQTPPYPINENAPRVGLLIEAKPVTLEPERIVLNTIKEPPILFESDREGYEIKKPEIVTVLSTDKSSAPVESKTSPSLNKNKEQKKAKKSSFCGLSCTGAKAEKDDKPTVEKSEKKSKVKKDKKKTKEPVESTPQGLVVDATAENKKTITVTTPKTIDSEIFKNLDAKPGQEPIKSMDLPAMIESVAPNVDASSNAQDAAKTSCTFSTSTKECNLDLSKYQSVDPDDPNNSGELVQKNPVFEKSDITVTKTIETKVNIVTLIEKAEHEEAKKEESISVEEHKTTASTTTTESKAEEHKKEASISVEENKTAASTTTTESKVDETSATYNKKGKKKNKKNKNVTPPPEEQTTTTTTTTTEPATIVLSKQDESKEIQISVEPPSIKMSPLISRVVEESTITTRIETNNLSTISDELIVISSDETIKAEQKSPSVELDVKTQIPIELSSDLKVEAPVIETNKTIEKIEFNMSKDFNLPKITEQKPVEVEVKKSDEKAIKSKKDKTKSNQEEAKKVKKTNTSCFACKSKKSKKDDKKKIEAGKDASATAQSNVIPIDASKVNLVNVSEDSSIKAAPSFKIQTQMTDKNFFHGLDPLPNASADKTIDIPSICSVETQKPLLKQTNSDAGDGTSIAFCKESVEQTPSMIGSTSIEIPNISQNENQNQVLVELHTSEIKLTSSTEQELPTISVEIDKNLPDSDSNKVEETLKIENEPKKLSDDIVVLPDPELQFKIPSLVAEKTSVEPKKEETTISKIKKDEAKNKKAKKDEIKSVKKEKSGNASCFSCKKQKSKEKIDKKDAPVSKPTVDVDIKVDTPAVLPEIHINKTPEDWAIGLDRKKDEPILNKDPVKFNTEPTPTPIASVNIDLPSVIEVVKPQIEAENKEKEINLDSIKKDIEIKLTTPDLSGAHIVIDRKPDHANIPIVQQEIVPKVSLNVSADTGAKVEVSKETKGDKKKPKEKSSKKTSILDLPLIKVLGPKKSKENIYEKKQQETEEKQPKDSNKISKTSTEIIDINKGIKLDADIKNADLPELKIEALTIENVEKEDKQKPESHKDQEGDPKLKLDLELIVANEIKSETKQTFESTYVKGDIEFILNKIEASEAELKKELQLETPKIDKETLVEISNKKIESVFAQIEGETTNQIVNSNMEFEYKKIKSEIVTESEINNFKQVLNELNFGSVENKQTILPDIVTPDLVIEVPKLNKPEATKEEIKVRVSDVVVLPAKEETVKDIKEKTFEKVDPYKLTETLVKEAKETDKSTKPTDSKKKKEPKEKKSKEIKEAKAKEVKKPKEKSKKGTSCMDMPLIDILIPKSVKNTKKKEKKSNSDKDNKNETKDIDAQVSSIENKPLEIKIDHGDLFKGLDPESINKTDKYPTSSPNTQVSVKIEEVQKEEIQQIEMKQETITVTQEPIKLKEEPQKSEEKSIKVKVEKEIQITTIDIPNVIDIDVPQIKLEDKKSKTKIESWSTDPLPHVVIGLHKLGSTEEPKTISTKATTIPDQSVEIKVPTDSKEKSKSKKPVKPQKQKESKNRDNKASCFSCKAKKSKKEVQKAEEKATEPKVTEKKDVSSKVISNIDLTSKLVNLDAPYTETPKDILDATELNKNLELINEPAKVEVEPLQQAQIETSILSTIVKEAFKVDEKQISEEIKNISDSIIEKIETAAIAEAINDEEVKQTIKIDTPSIPTIKVEKNIGEIEITKPTVEITRPGIEVKVKTEKPKTEKPKKEKTENPKKVKAEKSKEEKKSDPFLLRSSVSCFSCKSKKSKKEDKIKTDKTEADIITNEKTEQKYDASKSEKSNLSPEIHKDVASSDLFKGLDKPSVSECIHISDHQSFLDFKVEDTKVEYASVEEKSKELISSKSIEKVEETVESFIQKSEIIESETVEKLSSVTTGKLQSIEINTNITDTETNTTDLSKKQVNDQELIQKVIIPNLVITSEQQDLPKKLSDDIVVLPDPNLREVIIPKDDQAKKEQEKAPTELNDKDSKKLKKKSSASGSCFKCKSNKKAEIKKKSEKQTKESEKQIKITDGKIKEIDVSPIAVPWVKKQLVVEPKQAKLEAETPISSSKHQLDLTLLDQPAAPTETVKVGQPPKKPPRGHLDTTLMNIDVDTSIPLDVTMKQAVDNEIEFKKSKDEAPTLVAKIESAKETSPKNDKNKNKSEKTKSHKTSKIDMPLLDILKPKGAKKSDNKLKKTEDTKSKPVEQQVSIEVTSPNQAVNVDHGNLFKGLDPESITKTDIYPSTPVSQSILYEKVQKVEQKTTLTEDSKKISEITVKTEKIQEVRTVDLPTMIDSVALKKSEEQQYKSVKLETWTTDPLPTTVIGLHKLGSSDEPKKVESIKKAEINESQTTKNLAIDTNVNGKITFSKSQLVKLLSESEKKLLKSKKKVTLNYLKHQSNFKFEDKKKDKSKEKVVNKLFENSLELIIKQKKQKDELKHLTYLELRKKLEKYSNASSKPSSKLLEPTEIDTCVETLRLEIENGTIFEALKTGKDLKSQKLTEDKVDKKNAKSLSKTESNLDISRIAEKYKAANAASLNKERSTSIDKLERTELPPAVLRRFPSLTWREANERARILFYKGRVPSIHYNEKRDSFRVSMITQFINPTDGKEKTAEVPVCDDDVRRLLNSCGLYWNGESISLLNKSDEIFSSAQQEAFDFIQMINNANNAMFNQPSQGESEPHTENTNQEIKLKFVH